METSTSGMFGAGLDIKVFAPPQVATDTGWPLKIAGISQAHNVIVELFNANNGIFRYFPQGQDEIAAQYRFNGVGPTVLFITARDDTLRMIGAFMGNFEVVSAQSMQAGMAGASESLPLAGLTGSIMANTAPLANDFHPGSNPATPSSASVGDKSIQSVLDAKRVALLSRFKSKL